LGLFCSLRGLRWLEWLPVLRVRLALEHLTRRWPSF
jgi:hypothetical protein